MNEINSVYVSMHPGTVPAGAGVVIRNRATDFTIRVAMTSGGIDPVEIPAEENDTLDIVATDSSGANRPSRVGVRRHQPPVVVRSEPPQKKTEVPLNAAIVVVFSVPMDSTSITPQTIQLLANGQPVSIGVGLASDGFRAVVTPVAQLAPGTTYHLVTTTGVRDVTNESPATGTDLAFTTGTITAFGSRLSITPSAATLPVGSALQLTATIRDVNGNAIQGPRFGTLQWSGAGIAASVTATGLVRALQLGRATVSATADSAFGTAVIDVVGALDFAVGGSWDWTETISAGSTTCSDTGTYVFFQTGSDFTGTSQQAGVCTGRPVPDNSHIDPVTGGRAGGISLTFLVGSSCTYEARRTTTTDELSGTVVCGTASGTWNAHRPWPLSSVTLPAVPGQIVAHPLMNPVRLRAELRDTAGHRVFSRSVTWTNDAEQVGTLSADGDSALYWALAPGNATISASAAGKTGTFAFTVIAAASIKVTTTTTGPDPDPNGYLVEVYDGNYEPAQGPMQPVRIGANATLVLNPLLNGFYYVLLSDIADNCGPPPGFVPVYVGLAETAELPFNVMCGAAGSLRVITTSSGLDVPAGYSVSVDYNDQVAIGSAAELLVSQLGARTHTVELILPAHCVANGGNTRSVDVVGGATVDETFDVSCAPVGRIVFNDEFSQQLMWVAADGAAQSSLFVAGLQPAWAPDGTRLVFFLPGNCAGDTSQRVLCLMNADGSSVTPLPVSVTTLSAGLSWSPDGSRIVFPTSGGNLYVARVDGGGDAAVPNTLNGRNPDWSPDGSRIAFTCIVDLGNQDICVINADGTGLTRLTSDPTDDYAPRWSPDGSRLVFVTARFGSDPNCIDNPRIATMNADGSNAVGVAWGNSPDWSPDGGRLAFLKWGCYLDGAFLDVHVARTDGSGDHLIGRDYTWIDTPAWKP